MKLATWKDLGVDRELPAYLNGRSLFVRLKERVVGYLEIHSPDDTPFTSHSDQSQEPTFTYHVLNGCWDFSLVNGKALVLDELLDTEDVGYNAWLESVGLYIDDDIAQEHLKLWEANK